MRKRLPGLLMLLMVVTAVGAETLLAVGSKRIVLNHFIADPKQVSVIYVTDASGSGTDITATFYSMEGEIIGQKKTAVAANGTVSLIPMDIVKRKAYGRVVIESTGGKIIGEYWQIVEVEDAKYSIAVPAQPAIGRDKLVVQHFASDPNVTSVIYISESQGEGSVPVQIEFFDQSSNLLSKVSKTIPANGTIALKPYDVLQRKIVGSAYITTEGGPIIGEYWQVVNGKFPDPISGKEKKTNYGVAVPLQGKIVTPLSVVETPTEIRLTMEVHFDVDKADVREVDKANLAEAAKVIKRYFSDGDIVMVEGHTDESGEADYNLKLSQKRADNVKSFLVQQYGLEDGQLRAVGYGETRPVVPGATGDAGQVNRRVVFTIPKT